MFPGIRFQPVEAKGEADKKPLTVDGQAQPAFQLWFWRRTGGGDQQGRRRRAASRRSWPRRSSRLLNGNATLGDRKLLPEDIAVLVPENRQAQLVQDALSRAQRSQRALHQRQPV